MVTRRCAQRTFRLRPSPITNDIVRYCIAFAASKTGVLIHAVCVMSNHMHIVLTDVLGRLPDFVRELDRMLAKVMNALQGQWESLWSAEAPHYLELASDEDVVRKMAYVIANPVAAGLVEHPEQWPGILRWATSGAIEELAERPTTFFRANGPCPKEVPLVVTAPHDIECLDEQVRAEVERLVGLAHAEMQQKGIPFLGPQRVLKASFRRRATRMEQKRGIVPRVAAKSMFLRAAVLAAYRGFLTDYHAAMARCRGGWRDVVFPDGTWWMRVFHAARGLSDAGPAATVATAGLREAPA